MALFCESGFSRDKISTSYSKIAAEAAPTALISSLLQFAG